MDSESFVELDNADMSLSGPLSELFVVYRNPVALVKENRRNLENSAFFQYIENHIEDFQSYKKEIASFMKSGCKFQAEIFRRSFSALRGMLKDDVVIGISLSNPCQFESLYNSLPNETKCDLAVIVDLLSVGPTCQRFLLWIGRNLFLAQHPSSFGCDPHIKCFCLGQKRGLFGKSSNLFWVILRNDNNVELIEATNGKTAMEFKCDIVSLSRSGNSIKFSSNPSTIDLVFVPQVGYDSEMWESRAIRSKWINSFVSIPYFFKPLPTPLLSFVERSVLCPNMLIVRALLKPEVIPPNESALLIRAFFGFYAKSKMIHSFISVVCSIVFSSSPKDPSQLFKTETYLTHIFDIFYQEYGKDYYNQIIEPMFSSFDQNGSFSLNGSDPGIPLTHYQNTINTFFETIISSKDRIPTQFRHLSSIIKLSSGMRYSKHVGIYHAIAGFFFSGFIFNKKNNKVNHNKLLKSALKKVSRLKPFSEKHEALMPINATLDSLKLSIFKFVLTLSEMKSEPVYSLSRDADQTQALYTIIEEASKRRLQYINSVKQEQMTQAKSPLSLTLVHFLRFLSTSET